MHSQKFRSDKGNERNPRRPKTPSHLVHIWALLKQFQDFFQGSFHVYEMKDHFDEHIYNVSFSLSSTKYPVRNVMSPTRRNKMPISMYFVKITNLKCQPPSFMMSHVSKK